ncbi:hypothetical protein [Enterococcus faecalis]|uniref:hypothetical protein n=1 Tax=Enterococcus faecalis TaxID=1351 RepID=UPI0040432B0A
MTKYYHVKTLEDFNSLMVFLEVQGYRWSSGNKPTRIDVFDVYKEELVIEADEELKELMFWSTDYFEQMAGDKKVIEWTPELVAYTSKAIFSAMCQLGKILPRLQDNVKEIYKALEEATKKETMYVIPLPDLKTTDNTAQYLSFKNGSWFASRKNTWLKQRFTESELKEKVPEFYRELAVEVDE